MRLKAFQVVQSDFSLYISLAIGLRPASSKLHQQVNFCLLTARHYIWLCKTNELTLTLYGYLKYVKSIHRIHVHETANQSLPKEWTFLNGIRTELKLSFRGTLPYTLDNLVCIALHVFLLQLMLPLSSLVAFLFFLSFFLSFFFIAYIFFSYA